VLGSSLSVLAFCDASAGTPYEFVDLVGFTGEGWFDLRLPIWVEFQLAGDRGLVDPIPAEGLAEYVAHNLIDAPRWASGRQRGSREAYQANGGLATLFVAQSIDWFQYGQAWEFTEMMVKENTDGYRAFFNALKDGQDVHTAFEDHYGVPLDRLVRHYHSVYDRRGSANYAKP